VTDEDYVRRIEAQRDQERAWLRGPDSVLAAVARHEIPVGTTVRFGPDDRADVPLVGIDRAVVVMATSDGFEIDGQPSGPRTVEAGRYRLRLSHQNYPAAVVLDAESPRRHDAVEVRWYPVDPRLRLRARLEPDRARRTLGSTSSGDRSAERVGWVRLDIAAVEVRLSVARLLEPGVPEEHMEIYFRDRTTGGDSYVVGRYVAVEREAEDVVVDFNLAYNPACALSPYYNCPIPPAENHLTVPIRAGEMTPLVRSDGPHG
jgi:uncharacterized protein (DUF1684 family)